MSMSPTNRRTNTDDQVQSWADCEQYLGGQIDLEEYEKREREYEPDYETTLLAIARNRREEGHRSTNGVEFR